MTKDGLEQDMQIYRVPTSYLNSDSPEVVRYAEANCGHSERDIDKAVALYYAVRDQIRYNPYAAATLDRRAFQASTVLAEKAGFCVQKAILLAALARAVGIASRLGFADVRNHLNTDKLLQFMGTDIFTYHGYTELYLQGRWVKATPAFNRSLCEKFQVAPLEFNGKSDSIFQPFTLAGDKHMEYLCFHGHFADFPFEDMLAAFRKTYPIFFQDEQVATPEDDNDWDV